MSFLQGENMLEQQDNVYFRSEIMVTRNILNELKWNLAPSASRQFATIGILMGVILLIIFFLAEKYLLGVPSLALSVLFLWMYYQQEKALLKLTFERNLEVTGREDIEQIVAFLSQKIEIFSTITENKTFIDYNAIARCVQTKSTFSFFTKTNLFIVVDRTKLVDENKEEEFILFMREKCKNIMFRKSKQGLWRK